MKVRCWLKTKEKVEGEKIFWISTHSQLVTLQMAHCDKERKNVIIWSLFLESVTKNLKPFFSHHTLEKNNTTDYDFS